jgi:NAD(P)-dependent dehydrogenase (short-subunit alcohol dehydrogenase family)
LVDFSLNLEGKRIFITGSSSGIGLEVAKIASRNGAKVIIHGSNYSKLLTAFSQLEGDGHNYVHADLKTDEGLEIITNSIGNIDGFVVNAGVTYSSTLKNLNIDALMDVMNINVFSHILLIKSLYKNKQINNSGSIVITSSTASRVRASIGNIIYASSKGALEGFMGVATLEFASSGIRVNCVLPGLIDTGFIGKNGISSELYFDEIQSYPIKRLGTPTEVANGILFLLSTNSSYINGTSLIIDGGVSRL